MPPKAEVEGNPLSLFDIEFIVTVLKEVDTMEVDWRAVAATVGINRHDNAIARFNGILKKLGCKLIKGKIISLEDSTAIPSTPAKTPKAPKAPKTPKTPKTPASSSKRKAKEMAAAAENDEHAADKKPKIEENDGAGDDKTKVKAGEQTEEAENAE